MTIVYYLAQKSEIIAKFWEFVQMAEKQTGCSLEILRSDNDGEYVNNAMRDFLTSKGILQEIKPTKGNFRNYNQATMEAAFQYVKVHKIGFKTAAKKFIGPTITLKY